MPLKIFVADAGHRDRRQWCIEHGVGLLMSPDYATIPPPGATFMLDNGAFSAWKLHEEWNEKAFYRMVTRFHDAGLHPYGVVVPDIVKGGLESLKRSEEHLPLIPSGTCLCDAPFEVTVLKECPFAPGCFCVGDECMAWSSKSKRCLLIPREDGDA